MALPLSLKGFLMNLWLDTFLGVHLPQPPTLTLTLLHSLHKRRIHATILGPPLAGRRTAYAVLSA
jgi:hypothetical protein